MKTYNQTIKRLAEFRYDKDMAGAIDTRINVDQVAFIFEKAEVEVQRDVNEAFRNLREGK